MEEEKIASEQQDKIKEYENLVALRNKIKSEAKKQIKEIKLSALKKLAEIDTKSAKKLATRQKRDEKKALEAGIPKRYSIGEEIFNSVTHGIGAGLSIAALVLLIVRAVFNAPEGETGFYVTGFTLFGASLFVLYIMSTLYHALTPYGAKKVFAVFDHASIYLLIAGTYTPFCLGPIRGPWGWSIFGVIWGLAILGITFYSIFGSRMRILSAFTYVLMGWLVVIVYRPIITSVPEITVKFLFYGGIAYTIGVIFYALKKIKWTHSIWHIFVLAGSILHFFSVYFMI